MKTLWKLTWAIPVYCALGLFAILIAIFELNIKDGIDAFRKNT